jgi:hypothetical protein
MISRGVAKARAELAFLLPPLSLGLFIRLRSSALLHRNSGI